MPLKRRKLLAGLAAVPALVVAGKAHAEHYPAMLCGNCSFGSKGDNCVTCGKWIGSSKAVAFLCNDCGFGSKKENCVKCGKWAS